MRCASQTHPNVPQILMTSLTGRLVDKLTFTFENTKSVNFPQNNVIAQVDNIRNYVIVYLFTTRGVRSVKLTMLWFSVG